MTTRKSHIYKNVVRKSQFLKNYTNLGNLGRFDFSIGNTDSEHCYTPRKGKLEILSIFFFFGGWVGGGGFRFVVRLDPSQPISCLWMVLLLNIVTDLNFDLKVAFSAALSLFGKERRRHPQKSSLAR